MATLLPSDLRFNIAKLVPGSNGEPASWQNYINRAVNGAVEGTQERLAAGFAFGTLLNQGGGNYTYTFATDITSAAANPCPAPCTNADGKALNISYQPGLTHRVTIQQANSAKPKATGVLDFVPAGGAVSARDIVLTATCNQCHSELTAHGTRIDTKLCVTCHNPGSWVAGPPDTSVDFKVMIHKIHYNNAGAALPSVLAGGTPYKIGSKDFSTVAFTQDVRNCTRCHDGALSAQGDNWKNRPSMEACGSCHDNVYFGAQPDPARPYQTDRAPGRRRDGQQHMLPVPWTRESLGCDGQAQLAGAAQGGGGQIQVQHHQCHTHHTGRFPCRHFLGHRSHQWGPALRHHGRRAHSRHRQRRQHAGCQARLEHKRDAGLRQ